MEKYFALAKEGGADAAIKISAKSIVTAPWTIYRCQFGCDTYGKSHCCPPYTPKWNETQQMLDAFSYGILFRCHEMALVTPLAVKIARELFIDGYYKTIAFGSGACKKCKKCNIECCNFAGQTVPAMEACGIDVFATVRANGFNLQTLKDRSAEQSHFGLVMVE